MADLMLSNSTWSAGTTDTASTLANGIDQKRAEHINGPASAIISLETILGSASSLKGSHADLATRLSVAIPSSGVVIPPGVVCMDTGSTAPTGWLQCDGSSVSRSTYADLFARISTDYGNGLGDGLTFSLPDFRSRIPVGVGTGVGGGATGTTGTKPTGGATLKNWLRGLWYGEDTHQLTTAEMPAHTHTVTAGASLANNSAGGAQPIIQSVSSLTTSSAGSTQPHNVIQAGLGINFIIKT